jgi:pyruvate/2-oxoglutarate dehydrogenase complex dihydrolipoamide acyltransferase (E2) component
MPKLGLTMETGAVGTWLVGEGDEVKAGAVIAEIVTEKITYDLEAETAGVVLKILLAEEVEVPVGTPIIVIGQPGEEAS